MHELSVALALVECAEDKARELGVARVHAVHVRIGPLAGVLSDPLLFAFDLAARDTLVDGARLVIEPEPVVAWCARCVAERPLTDIRRRRCPACDEPTPELVSGDALELLALEVADDVPAHS